MVVTKNKRKDGEDDDDFEVPLTVIEKKKLPEKSSKKSMSNVDDACDDDFVLASMRLKKRYPSEDEGSHESNPMPSTRKPSKLNIVHGVRERENYVKQYRSNIVSLINLMQDIKFTERYITALERTTFGMLFKSFWNKEHLLGCYSNLFGRKKMWC